MSPSEIAFLALGLVLGVAAGVALAQAIARRPTGRREIRLTITPNAIPTRRASTLAMPKGIATGDPVPGSPAALALFDDLPGAATAGSTAAATAGSTAAAPAPVGRTRVPSGAVEIPATAIAVPVVTSRAASDPGAVAVLEAPPDVARPASRAAAFTTLVRPRSPSDADRPRPTAGAVAVRVHSTPILRPIASAGPPGNGGAASPGAAQPGGLADPCTTQRRLVDERCALAEAAREQARSAADALREAQRLYDILRDRVDRAQLTADPRHVAAAKERLHAEFRQQSDRSRGPDETEAAARAWLQEINELNTAVRDAQRVLEAGSTELRAQVPVLDRLAAEADAARIRGESAEGVCRDAREALAACEEAEAQARARALVPPPEEPHPFAGVWPADLPDLPEPVAPADLLAGRPVIVRVLRGDREARQRLVAALGAGDPDGERDWGLRVSRLVDAIVARAIEDGYLDMPAEDPFWRLFEHREVRDIVGALSALGYRYDGMGGFADGRVPAPRDLSLAVGYAGLDRMRIRTWPRDQDIGLLYEQAVVASDEWLADQAGDLSLGRMVDALGNRAAELADVWNAWGRVRPALLDA